MEDLFKFRMEFLHPSIHEFLERIPNLHPQHKRKSTETPRLSLTNWAFSSQERLALRLDDPGNLIASTLISLHSENETDIERGRRKIRHDPAPSLSDKDLGLDGSAQHSRSTSTEVSTKSNSAITSVPDLRSLDASDHAKIHANANESPGALLDPCGEAACTAPLFTLDPHFVQAELEGSPLLDSQPVEEPQLDQTIALLTGADEPEARNRDHVLPVSFTQDEAIDVLTGRATRKLPKSVTHTIDDCVVPEDDSRFIVTVEVMFPFQFAAMRYLYGLNSDSNGIGDADVTTSLLRTKAFKAQGGRSGSGFSMTLDERFLLKRIKQQEIRHFARFGPSYFAQMLQVFSHCSQAVPGKLHAHISTSHPPSLLAKIFGIFSVQVRRGRRRFIDEIHYYVVSENLKFQKMPSITYDLKGSQRKRTAVEGSAVMLDEDLVRHSKLDGFFFFCRDEEKKWVSDCLTNDCSMLVNNEIMDYSLLVFVDVDRAKCTIGIVDYLHPYTGAKLVESKMKGALETVVGGGKDPTIIEPVHYRLRFLRWMDMYFCSVPSKLSVARKRQELMRRFSSEKNLFPKEKDGRITAAAKLVQKYVKEVTLA
jgi:hypothetical protein